MSDIVVSIVIPAYNVEKSIYKAVMSALNQTLKNIEVIVVNDGSTDDTLKILQQIEKKHPNLQIYTQSNRGLLFTRFAGIKVANGEYILSLDSDDYIESNSCEMMYSYAKKNNLDILVSDFFQEDKNGSTLRCDIKIDDNDILDANEYLQNFFFSESYNTICNKLIRKSLYENFKIPEEKLNLGEDLLQTVVLASKSKKIGKINRAFLHYQYNSESITNQQKSKNMYQLFLVYEYVKINMEPKLYSRFKQKILLDQFKLVASFLSQIPYFDDENYNKGIKKSINFLKENSSIPLEVSLVKRTILKMLSKKTTLPTFRFLVFFSNLLLKHRVVKI